MKIYIAAPLFNEMETKRNLSVSALLEGEGFEVYLPQRDGGVFYNLKERSSITGDLRRQIFESDFNAIVTSDIVLCLLDGRVLDEGLCIEVGIGYGLGKYCVGYKTDHRCQDRFGNNIMVDGVLSEIFTEKKYLVKHLLELKLDDVHVSSAIWEGSR